MGVVGGGMVKGKEQKKMISRVPWLLLASACPATFVPLGWLHPSQQDGQTQELETQMGAWPPS